MFVHVVTLHCEVNPIAWKSPTAFALRKGGKVRAGVAPAVEVATYQHALREQFQEQWGKRDPILGPVHLAWRFNRQLVSYRSESGRIVTKHRQDLTNMVKAAEDCLQAAPKLGWQGVIVNDVQVEASSAMFIRQEKDVTDPYVEVEVWALPENVTPIK